MCLGDPDIPRFTCCEDTILRRDRHAFVVVIVYDYDYYYY